MAVKLRHLNAAQARVHPIAGDPNKSDQTYERVRGGRIETRNSGEKAQKATAKRKCI